MALPDEAAEKIQCNTPEGPGRVWHVETPARLEIFPRTKLPDASRESIRRALAAGAGSVDGVVCAFGYRLKSGALVILDPAVRLSEDDDLIAVFRFTGRTNQIRIHCAAIGHPIIGDAKYGGPRRRSPDAVCVDAFISGWRRRTPPDHGSAAPGIPAN